MKQKRVSFKVAKVIKEAGYPQYSGENYWWKEGSYLSRNIEPIVEIYKGDDYNDYRQYLYYAPTYLDVWLWLWREKKKSISIICDEDDRLEANWYVNAEKLTGEIGSFTEQVFFSDPEEAIASAIEYLVDNDLIK